jgi:LuxR family maltose regulon positive regulatory protein
MLRTAMLQELTPQLCEAMTGIKNSEEILQELVQKGVFITRLQDGTYRYQHLFQQFLRRTAKERGEEFLYSLLETEGYRHLEQKNFPRAVDCFIRCKNHRGIGETYVQLATSDIKEYVLVRLLPIFNHAEVIAATAEYPHLLYVAASCAFFEGRVEDTIRFMDEYYARRDEITEKYPGLAGDGVLMHLWDFRTPVDETLREPNMRGPSLRGPALARSVSMHMPLYHRGVVDFSSVLQGDMEENLNDFFQKIGHPSDDMLRMRVGAVSAGLTYEQGNFTNAHEHAVIAAAEMKSHFPTDSKLCAMSILVSVLDEVGEEGEADSVLQSISRMLEADNAFHLAANFDAFLVRRKIAADDIKAAEKWIKESENPGHSTLYGMYIDFTMSRAYICTGQYDLAIVLLKKVLGMATDFNRTLDILEAQILLTIAYWKKKRGLQKNALDYLEDAIFTAEPYGYVQMFLAEGAALSDILYKLQKRVEQRPTEERGHLSFVKMLYLRTQNAAGTPKKHEKPLIKFTDKQKAVMDLLCQGKTRKDIAETLGIKQPTLRTHLDAIYGKLEVSNVASAVTKINAMKLMEG